MNQRNMKHMVAIIACWLTLVATPLAFAAETTDPLRATVQVRYGQSSGSGTAISPTVIITCAHIHGGEAGGQTFMIEKHWHDGTDQYRGYLLAQHADLDLALISVPEASLDHVQLVATDPPTPQAATFYGHAAARREILSFRGYISRGFTTNFDIVAGHDSIEGQSGGGVFNEQGELLGVMHGRPNAVPSTRGGGIFTPMRHVRTWIATDCRGPQCQRWLPPQLQNNPFQMSPPSQGYRTEPQADIQRYGNVAPPPSRTSPSEPRREALKPEVACPPVDFGPLLKRLDELSQRIDKLAEHCPPEASVVPASPPAAASPANPSPPLAEVIPEVDPRLGPIIDQRIEEAIRQRVPHYFSIVPRKPQGK